MARSPISATAELLLKIATIGLLPVHNLKEEERNVMGTKSVEQVNNRCLRECVYMRMMLFKKLNGFCRCFKLPVSVQSARNVYMYSPEPFHPIPDREPRLTTAEEAVSVVTTGNDVLDLETFWIVSLSGHMQIPGTNWKQWRNVFQCVPGTV